MCDFYTIVVLLAFRKQSEITRADWLKIVFLQLAMETQLARAVDVIMARARNIYLTNKEA